MKKKLNTVLKLNRETLRITRGAGDPIPPDPGIVSQDNACSTPGSCQTCPYITCVRDCQV
jgi:hypothetical protein